MRYPGLLFLCIALAMPIAATPVAATGAAATDTGLPDLVASLLNAVVNISVLKKAGSDPTDPPGQTAPDHANASGFTISPDGYIVTNNHVVEGGYDITVAFADGSTFPAEIASTNRRPDLALLKITTPKPLPFVRFGDSDALRIGETVMAIGNPLGLSSSLSVGVVSALNRDVNMTMIDDFIQTDAAINHGNSGGPLFNRKGEVIGVNWAIFTPGQQSGSAGLGLAIPSNDAAWVVDEMRRYGKMRPGFAGFRLQQVTPAIQTVLGLPSRTGGIVTGVIPDAPASKVAQEGDVILALNGHEPHDVRALLRDLSANLPGTRISLKIWRDGVIMTVDLTLTSWPDNLFDPAGPQPDRNEQSRQTPADLGLQLAVADAGLLKQSAFFAGHPGVAIVGVSGNSPAADLRIYPGDVILRIGSDQVATPDDVRSRLDQARAAGRRDVLMLIQAGNAPRWVVMPLTGR